MGRFLIGERNHLKNSALSVPWEIRWFSLGISVYALSTFYGACSCFCFGGDAGDLPFKIEQSNNSFSRSVFSVSHINSSSILNERWLKARGGSNDRVG